MRNVLPLAILASQLAILAMPSARSASIKVYLDNACNEPAIVRIGEVKRMGVNDCRTRPDGSMSIDAHTFCGVLLTAGVHDVSITSPGGESLTGRMELTSAHGDQAEWVYNIRKCGSYLVKKAHYSIAGGSVEVESSLGEPELFLVPEGVAIGYEEMDGFPTERTVRKTYRGGKLVDTVGGSDLRRLFHRGAPGRPVSGVMDGL